MKNEDSRYSRLSLDDNDDNGHVLYNTFGLKQSQRLGLIDKLLRESPAVRPVAAAQLSLMAYQTDYGIYDHINGHDKNRPLALMALHPKENTYEGGPMFSMVRRYYTYRLSDYGVSLPEFMELPYPLASLIMQMAEDTIKQKDSAAERAERELQRQMDKGG